MKRFPTSVAITDPLIKYQSLLATGVYSPDPAQHRLAHHLQKLYVRLKDYTPPVEFRSRLRELTQALDRSREPGDESAQLAVDGHPIWGNPLFARFFNSQPRIRDSRALIRILASHEAAIEIDSPKGLFLSGEVGTGKSMLIDLLAEGLPTSKKRRWHFNTFMLYTLSRLEQFRRSHPDLSRDDQEYSLFWMAKELIEESPILFLDEFQLPDRAASKILSHLFIVFFRLGGVLVASSNRVPEELEKAIGVQHSPPPSGGLFSKFMTTDKRRSPGELFGQTSDFAAFLDVLKARCDFWHMETTKDWRRREAGLSFPEQASATSSERDIVGLPVYDDASGLPGTSGAVETVTVTRPAKYILFENGESWRNDPISEGSELSVTTTPWKPSQLVVYGRKLTVPCQHDGVSCWQFEDLAGSFGPADYITLASNYHTFVIDGVPVLTLARKNEARRFITFLDALYEARCKLIVRAEVCPDELFFPETASSRPDVERGDLGHRKTDRGEDATYSETISEVYQDQMSPFRPNVSTYSESRNSRYDPDQDSDFDVEGGRKIDFSNSVAFTGEDERFAYKRAASRLWELCSSQWHARTGDWWQPLPTKARHWEDSAPSAPLASRLAQPPPGDVSFGPSHELDEPAGLERFRLAALKKAQE